MKIIIERVGENIVTVGELTNPKDSGEVAHFISELERLKLDLIDLWESLKDYGEGE